jgi:8-oxo-dGTP pyrophosphatase MutT (NUDIX family)
MGFPGHTIDVPPAAPAPELAALVRSARRDPFGWRERLASALEGQDGQDFAGHLCATAWVLDASRSQVLLVRHPVLGHCTPGGHVEEGESPDHAAARELREETRLNLAPASEQPDVLHPVLFPAGATGPAHWHHNLGYVFVADVSQPVAGEPGAPVAWFAVDGLPAPRVDDLDVILPLLVASP